MSKYPKAQARKMLTALSEKEQRNRERAAMENKLQTGAGVCIVIREKKTGACWRAVNYSLSAALAHLGLTAADIWFVPHITGADLPQSMTRFGGGLPIGAGAKSFHAIYGRDPEPGRDFDPTGGMTKDDYEFFNGDGQYKQVEPGPEYDLPIAGIDFDRGEDKQDEDEPPF